MGNKFLSEYTVFLFVCLFCAFYVFSFVWSCHHLFWGKVIFWSVCVILHILHVCAFYYCFAGLQRQENRGHFAVVGRDYLILDSFLLPPSPYSLSHFYISLLKECDVGGTGRAPYVSSVF
jgi:hypothetical protein